MLAYNVRLALLSLRKTPVVSAICILAIALGIGVASSLTSVHHLFAQNPFPEKSDRLFNVRIDNWDPNSEFFGREGEPPKTMAYRDMAGLMTSTIPVTQTGVAEAAVYVFPEKTETKPYQISIQLVHSGFWSLTEAPYDFGSPWQAAADTDLEAVVVLSRAANEKLFGGIDSVGEQLRMGPREFTVIGVLGEFTTYPKYYDIVNTATGIPREVFMPFDWIRDPDFPVSLHGNTDGWGDSATFVGDLIFTAAEFNWIQFWVELDPDRVGEYESFVTAYVEEQKKLGRCQRPMNNRVTAMMPWIDQYNRMTGATSTLALISYFFLAVCAINLTGLLLSKFLARSSLAGIRRALGASRGAIFAQHIIECEVIGLLGGLVGIPIAVVSLRLINSLVPAQSGLPSDLFQADLYLITVALLLSMLAGLLAGIFPAWRACRVAPAMQIKIS